MAKARLVYVKFIADGRATGHQPDYYDVRDQRFLGDEKFVEEIEERVQGDREIATPMPLIARAYGATERDLIQAGRQRKWIKARSMLVYLGREWGRMSIKELARRLHRELLGYQPPVLSVYSS